MTQGKRWCTTEVFSTYATPAEREKRAQLRQQLDELTRTPLIADEYRPSPKERDRIQTRVRSAKIALSNFPWR